MALIRSASTLILPMMAAAGMGAQAVGGVQVTQSARGFDAVHGTETIRVSLCGDAIVHVVTRPDARTASHPQPWLLPADQSCAGAPFTFSRDDKNAVLTGAKLKVTMSLERGNLTFTTADGKELLREGNNLPRTYVPVTLNGEQTYHVVDRFAPNSTEAFYGLGQHQGGLFDYRGATVELGQNNTDIAIPLLTSTLGYGLLWNSAAFSYMDNRFPLEMNFDSMAGDGADYFVLYGPEMDGVIHQYRNLTGHAPMLPRWAYGFIQSKDRYTSLDEIQKIAQRYRGDHIPMDAMVQDWYWWKTEGDPVFNENYHDVPAVLAKLHDEHVHTMISTWGLLDKKSETYKALSARGLMIADAQVYDASSAEAREAFWKHLDGPLFAMGWDSFWLDSAEPEEIYPHVGDAVLRDKKMAIGSGAMYTNVFPLMHNLGIQEHWRRTTDQKRVFLLTRSSFLGQQRVGGTVWSGDVYSNFWALKKQVPAGLNYALSGLPYWTTDIGGYHPYGIQITDPAYQELYLRWFEFGVFCPVFRTHGHRPENELWSYAGISPTLIAYDKLRYRLMPYIYSLGWKVSSDDYTIERPLVMDFRADGKTWDIGDQFMFGPALMVSPVTEAGATERRVYLPKDVAWYDFWTGQKTPGGRMVEAGAPKEKIPLYVRAGSIVPMGPVEEYTGEHPDGPIELRVYAGADGAFSLYGDEGDNYNYEKGGYAVVPMRWSDAGRTLTLGTRAGSYAGMPAEVVLHVVMVGAGHGVGGEVTALADRTLTYRGQEMSVRLP